MERNGTSEDDRSAETLSQTWGKAFCLAGNLVWLAVILLWELAACTFNVLVKKIWNRE
jgi:hypothetical protein